MCYRKQWDELCLMSIFVSHQREEKNKFLRNNTEKAHSDLYIIIPDHPLSASDN